MNIGRVNTINFLSLKRINYCKIILEERYLSSYLLSNSYTAYQQYITSSY